MLPLHSLFMSGEALLSDLLDLCEQKERKHIRTQETTPMFQTQTCDKISKRARHGEARHILIAKPDTNGPIFSFIGPLHRSTRPDKADYTKITEKGTEIP